jgi:hypothetical protein
MTEIPQATGRAQLSILQRDLHRISGVTSARVVGDTAPSEIHIVATLDRLAKQIVRDVQSLATARFGMSIDHRIVSVVQLEKEAVDDSGPIILEDVRRPRLERVIFANTGTTGWVKVALRWPDGELTEGSGDVGATRESRARGAGTAVVGALDSWLTKRNAVLDLESVVVQPVGTNACVTVHAVMHDDVSTTPLVGAALIYDDVATAAVHAMLHALNRKIG